MQLTQKIRIFPTKEQQDLLWILAERCRLIYNFALKERIEHWERMKLLPETNRTFLTYQDQQNQLPELKQKFSEYKWVYSKVLQMTLKKLDADYKSFFTLIKNDPNARPPNYKGKKYFTTLCYNQSGFQFDGESIIFSHKHPSKILLQCPLSIKPQNNIIQAEIFLNKQNKWFVALTYNVLPITYIDNGKYQAIDLGIMNIVSAVNIQGKTIQIKNNRADLYWKKKLEIVQSKRDHCKNKSRKWKRYHQKYCKMKHKCSNQLKDFQHKVSQKIVSHTKANTIIIGDLDVKKMAKHTKERKSIKTLHHSLQNTGFMSRFAQFLSYKAEKIGKKVIRINEAYTTQVCARCGEQIKRSLSERVIHCDCGNTIDRDINSAINIMVKFLLSLSHEPSVNEESFLKNWKGFTTIHSPIRVMDDQRLVGSHVL